MNNYGEVLENGAMVFVREFPGPIERVWSWVVDADKRARWLCGGDNITHAGQSVIFAFRHENLTPHDEALPEKYKDMKDGVSFDISVVRFEPPDRITFEWPGARGEPSIVDIQLTEIGDTVTLTLRQHGDINAEELIGALAGWHTHFAIMLDAMTGKTPEPFWAAHEALSKDYEKRTAP